MICFQLKLSTGPNAIFHLNYVDLAIPLWTGGILGILSTYRYVFFSPVHIVDFYWEDFILKLTGIYTLFAIPLTCTFAGLYFDQKAEILNLSPSNSSPLVLIPSLKFALYPMIPSEIGLFLITIIACWQMLRSRCNRSEYTPISSIGFKYHLILFQLFLNMSIAAAGLHYWIITDPSKIGSILLLTMFFYGFVQFYLFHYYIIGDDEPALLT